MTFSKKIYCKSTKNQWKGVYNNVMKFCIDAGFLTTVGVGQYFMTRQMKNSHDLQSQWHVVSTLCQEVKNHVTRKVGFEGTPRLGPCWKSQPATYKVNLEWKLEWSLFTDSILTRGSQIFMAWISWPRTSATTKRTTTISRKPMRCSSKMLRWKRMYLLLRAELRLNQNHKDVIMSGHPQELYPSGKERGLVEPTEYSPVAYPFWKQLSTLLRHGHLPQEDGAIEFLECKDYLRNKFVRTQHWSDEMWKSRMTKGGWNKKRFQSFTDSSGGILYFRALQRHSGRNLIDPSLQDNVVVPEGFLQAHLSLSDVQSIYTPSWNQDWYQEDKI